jgi:hypothetical protein
LLVTPAGVLAVERPRLEVERDDDEFNAFVVAGLNLAAALLKEVERKEGPRRQ